MGLLNYTTKIDPDKTAQEISKCLSSHGAKAVMIEYDQETNLVKALSFQIALNDKDISFRLPCDWKPVYTILIKGKKEPPSWNNKRAKWKNDWEAQAVRTAWRIVKDWVEAQMALVETQMVTTAQVFLPYAVMQNNKTLSENIADNPKLLLGDGQ